MPFARRQGFRRPIRGTSLSGGAGTGPAGPVITTVSQTAGNAAGASVVNVTGTGFAVGMTSALGAVSSITGTTCVITTNAHAAGSLTWTLTTNLGSAANQTFTYLATPTLTSLSPVSGPATITNTGVTFTGTSFPASGTGCPMTVTVGAGAGTPTLNNSTTCSSSFTAPGLGVVTASVTVDGVTSSTLASAYTGNPAPSEISASNVDTGGGTGNISGLNFVATPTGSVNINGTPTAITITFVDSAHLTYVLPNGSYTAGTWPLTIKNPDGQSVTQTIFPINSTKSFQTIYGSDLVAAYEVDIGLLTGGSGGTVPLNGGTADYWQDQSGNSYHVTASGALRPVYNTVSSYSPGEPSLTFDGVNQLMTNAAVTFGSTTDIAIFIVAKWLGSGTSHVFAAFTDNGAHVWGVGIGTSANTPGFKGNPGWVNFASALTMADQIFGGAHNTAGNNFNISTTVANATPASTGTLSQAFSSGVGTIAIGGSVSTPNANIEVQGVYFVKRTPSTQDLSDSAQYLNLRWLNRSPTFTQSTIMYQTGTGFRVKGGAFVSGAKVSFGGGLGVATQNAVLVSTSVLEVPMPGTSLAAGSYPITIQNPDGGAIDVGAGIVISNTIAATPMTVTGDLSCVGWYDGNAWTLVTGAVSAMQDQSLRGNDLAQSTSASRPTANSSDANFGNTPSWHCDGTQMHLDIAAFSTGLSTPAMCVVSAARFDAANTNTGMCWSYLSGMDQGCSAGKPQTGHNQFGVQAIWGSTIGGTTKHLYSENPSGANPTLLINVNNGTAVTQTTAVAALGDGTAASLGCNAGIANFYKGELGFTAVFNRVLTSTEQANMRTLTANLHGT